MLTIRFHLTRLWLLVLLGVCLRGALCQAQQQDDSVRLASAHKMSAPGLVFSVAVSSDEHYVAAGCVREVGVWTMEGKPVITLKADATELKRLDNKAIPESGEMANIASSLDGVVTLAFSPDGSRLAGLTTGAGVGIWSLPDGKLLRALPPHPKGTFCFAWSPDGKTMATGGGDHVITLWDTSTGQVQSKLDEHLYVVRAVAFAEDKTLISVGMQPKIGRGVAELKRWNLDTGVAFASVSVDKVESSSLVLSPRGQLLISCNSGFKRGDGRRQFDFVPQVVVWDANHGNAVQLIESEKEFSKLAVSVQEDFVLATGNFVQQIDKGLTGLSNYYSFKGAEIWDIKTGQLIAWLENKDFPKAMHDTPIPCAFSISNKVILAYRSVVEIWQVP